MICLLQFYQFFIIKRIKMKNKVLPNRLSFLFAIFISLLIIMNLMGGKITTLFGVSVSVAIFLVPLTFLITDIVSEVYGREVSQKLVYMGMIVIFLTMLITKFFIYLSPNQRYTFNTEYAQIFGSSLRMMLASLLAFGLSQLNDVFVFHYLKKKSRGEKLWLRNNVSTIISQAIDTIVFMLVAFWGISPKFDLYFVLIGLGLPYYLFKVLFALLDTPFVYLGVKWLEKNKE